MPAPLDAGLFELLLLLLLLVLLLPHRVLAGRVQAAVWLLLLLHWAAGSCQLVREILMF